MGERTDWHRAWYHKNRADSEEYKTKKREYDRAYYQKNKAYKHEYRRKKYAEDIDFRLAQCLRTRVKIKAGSATRDLGCTIAELRQHLELQFQNGMSWGNYGDEWHMDHIEPLANFDLTSEEQYKLACHYSNLQPMWAHENLSKGAR